MTMTSPRPKSADRHALRAGFTLSKNHRLTKIDRWFLVQIKEIVDFEEELASAPAGDPCRMGHQHLPWETVPTNSSTL
jgi:hypothetical protein